MTGLENYFGLNNLEPIYFEYVYADFYGQESWQYPSKEWSLKNKYNLSTQKPVRIITIQLT